MLPRISVDFNTTASDPKERVLIPTHTQPELLGVVKPRLRDILYEEDDIEVEAVLEFDATNGEWFGVPDWTTLHEL